MKKILGLFMVIFIIFGTYALSAPPEFGRPGVIPDPGAEFSPITYPNIEGTWGGKSRDIRFVDPLVLPFTVGPYTTTLVVNGQDGARFVGWLDFNSESGPETCTVAGYINGDGEITMFGGAELYHSVQRFRLTAKAKLYKNPERSIRGYWQAFYWEEGGHFDQAYSGSFVLTPVETQSNQ